jgi:hypothetical protein
MRVTLLTGLVFSLAVAAPPADTTPIVTLGVSVSCPYGLAG